MSRLFAAAILVFSASTLWGQHPDDLAARLPESALLQRSEGSLRIVAGDQSYPVLAADARGRATISVGDQRIAIDADVLRKGSVSAIAALPRLLARASESKLELEDAALAEDAILGPHLRSDRHIVRESAALGAVVPTATDQAGLARGLTKARTALESAALRSPLARQSIASVLDLIEDPSRESDTLTADLARRLVRHGWLQGPLGSAADDLEREVRAAQRPTDRVRFESDQESYIEAQSLRGRQVRILRSPAGLRIRLPLRPPAYHPEPPEADLVLEIEPGQDPYAFSIDAVRSAEVIVSEQRLARWTKADGFSADAEAWTKAFQPSARDAENFVPGFLPPHVLIQDAEDDVLALITAHGTVSADRTDTERFLAEAVQALPDGAHLDLIGQFLFDYVNDSPDPRYPELIGTEDGHGEIHQTITETLATLKGGVCRGDCDDLAEIYHEITTRSGQLGHIISLPGHAALLYAQKSATGYRTTILQTGPPLSFEATTLPEALKQSYGAFGMIDAFDPDQVAIAVRFSGENIRSNWVLSWRIFDDPAYAKTMIDIQRDWHDHTFAQGIRKTQALLDAGDDDAANHRELAGLYRSIGDYRLAAERLGIAIEKGGDPTLSLSIDRVFYLLKSNQREAALALAKEIQKVHLPKAAEDLGPAFAKVAMHFVTVLAEEGDEVTLAAEVAERYLTSQLTRLNTSLATQVERGAIPASVFRSNMELSELRRLLRDHYVTAMAVIEAAERTGASPTKEVERLGDSAALWLRTLAFHDIELPGDIAMRYAQVAGHYAPMIGVEALDAAVAAAPFPTAPRDDHHRRVGTYLQFRRDLPWIKASVPHFSYEINNLFAEREQTFDRARFDRLQAGLAAARSESTRLGMDDFQTPILLLGADLLRALIHEDEALLHKILREIKATDDKIWRDTCVNLLGLAARFVSDAMWEKAVTGFGAEVDHAPSWFQIAWTAQRLGAHEKALRAADEAVRLHSDRSTFAEERAFLLQRR